MTVNASRPVVLISGGRQNLASPRRETQDVWTGCHVDYVKSVLRSGGAPLVLSYLADAESISAALDCAQGVLLSGGGDVVSLAYGEQPHPQSRYQDPVRDEMEFELTRQALERNIPILGICRGIQVLNVALGGTLVQHIAGEVENAYKHYSSGLAPTLLHDIEIEEDSVLANVMGSRSLAVNSWHHQSVKQLGKGLRVSARSGDGVIEGIESSEGKPILAVQCHPEEVSADYPQFQAIFNWLVEEAAKHRSE